MHLLISVLYKPWILIQSTQRVSIHYSVPTLGPGMTKKFTQMNVVERLSFNPEAYTKLSGILGGMEALTSYLWPEKDEGFELYLKCGSCREKHPFQR